MNINQPRHRRYPVFIVIAIISVILAGYAFTASRFKLWPFVYQTDEAAVRQAEVDSQKDQFAAKENASTKTKDTAQPPNGTSPASGAQGATKASTSVIITYAGENSDNIIEVNAYMPEHYEDGTCTITFVQGSQKLERSSPAFRDATTTICTNPLIKASDFPSKGIWNVTVAYESNGASGVSTAQAVTVQ